MASTVVSIQGLSRLRRSMKAAEVDMGLLKGLNRAAAGVVEGAASSATPTHVRPHSHSDEQID